MNRFFVQGTKKLFSLTKTKIRLAEEAGTDKTRPSPLPLVQKLSGLNLETVEQAKDYVSFLRNSVNFKEEQELAKAVLQLMDIIEGVKYKFEPKDAFLLLSDEDLEKVGRGRKHITILLDSQSLGEGVNLYFGFDPPRDSIHAGTMPSPIATLVDFLFNSRFYFKGERLRNVSVRLGGKTLLLNTAYHSLLVYGALQAL
ncbi:MAG: hypothetical protein ABH950_01285 [Candidatus Altiarchaeota archaeon]